MVFHHIYGWRNLCPVYPLSKMFNIHMQEQPPLVVPTHLFVLWEIFPLYQLSTSQSKPMGKLLSPRGAAFLCLPNRAHNQCILRNFNRHCVCPLPFFPLSAFRLMMTSLRRRKGEDARRGRRHETGNRKRRKREREGERRTATLLILCEVDGTM